MPTLIQIPNVEDRRPAAEKRLRVVAYCRVSTRQEEQETASSSGEIPCSLSPLLPDKVPQANVIIPEILSTISNRFGSICTSHCAPSVSKENIYSVSLLQISQPQSMTRSCPGVVFWCKSYRDCRETYSCTERDACDRGKVENSDGQTGCARHIIFITWRFRNVANNILENMTF